MLRLLALAGAVYLCSIVLSQLLRRAKQQHLRNLPGPPSSSFLTGVAKDLHNPHAVPYRERVLSSYGRVIKFPAFLGEVEIALSDPVALGAMFGKHRDAFEIPKWQSETHNAVFGPNLMSVSGSEHHKQRKHLNPIFSAKYLRQTVFAQHRIAQELTDVLKTEIGERTAEVELSEYFSRYSLEAVGRTTLGYTFGPLKKHGTDYSRALKEFGPTLAQLHLWRPLLPWLRKTFPPALLRSGVGLLPMKALHHMQWISDSVFAMSKQLLNQKMENLRKGDEALLHEVGEGKDLMSVLLRENMSTKDVDSLSEPELLGQMSLLLLAATDTTSSSISRAMQLLSIHRDAQDRLRRELVDATKHTGRTIHDFDFDTLASLPYLDAVVKETLRLFPPFYLVMRSTQEDVVLPLGSPVTGIDGKQIHELFLPAGTLVWPNVFWVNRDPEIWGADAAEWKPERWLGPLPESLTEAHIPSIFAHTITFAAGPRSCIGYNLAVTEMRIALAHLLLSFEFAPSDKEIVWKFGGIVTPTVRGSTARKPELPVKVTAL
ncbi:cytochrome P450 [Lentinus tigrinus ALCF2SS1-7]|uniref:Cytochrome P450 n=1 Tax=Lentinus tigrinus ALCF2SS1-6 TaxID=1328759 RepID=A0A5C2RPU6_9APHY|nr:cytochrome P450 [Lentinus tigrinus ALCF2SS1-6]RPD75364.1 cytochrome P450 [Lentinus tigrinus ALCF2SS1-7]